MDKQKHVRALAAAAILSLLLLSGILGTAGLPAADAQAQPNPTEQQATINAIVDQYFTQTAEAQQMVGATQTIEAAFRQAQIATAEAEATIQAAFNQALTATAAFGTAVQESFDRSLTATAEAALAARSAEMGLVPITNENVGDMVEILRIGRGMITDVAWSPDGKTLAVGSTTGVWLYDAANPEAEPRFLEGHTDSVFSVAYSPDGQRLASGNFDGTVRIWDAASGQVLTVLEGHRGSVTSIAYGPDGKTLASGSWDGTVRLWDVPTGVELATLLRHTVSVTSIAYRPDGKTLASGSWDGTVRLWDAASGQVLTVLEGHTRSVNSVAYSPDGTQLASAGEDSTVRLWDAVTGAELTVFQNTGWVNRIAYSPDGTQLVLAGGDGMVRVWDTTASGQSLTALEGHTGHVTSVAYSPDGTQLTSAGEDGMVRVWDTASGQALTVLEGHTRSVNSVAYSPDGTQLASAGEDGMVRVWDTASGQVLTVLEGHRGSVTSVAYSPDGTQLASAGGDRTVRLWDAVTGAELNVFQNTGWVNSIAYSPDGRRLAGASSDGNDNSDKKVRLWDVATGAELVTLQGETHQIESGGSAFIPAADINSVAFSPDGMQLASASHDTTVRLWDVARGRVLAVLTDEFMGQMLAVAFSPDGTMLAASGGGGTVKLWDVATGAELTDFWGHSSLVYSVAFNPDGTILVSGGGDRTIRLWNVATGAELVTLKQGQVVNSVAFSPDGMALASAADDGTIRLWGIPTGELAAQATESRQTRPVSVTPLTEILGNNADVTTAAISPDGSTIAYYKRSDPPEICLYSLESGQTECHADAPQLVPSSGLLWSPDSRFITFHDDFFRTFREPDIWVFDTQTGSSRNLTDDSVSGNFFSDVSQRALANIDVLPVWHPTKPSQLYFFRYAILPLGDANTYTLAIYSLNIETAEIEWLGNIETQIEGLPVRGSGTDRQQDLNGRVSISPEGTKLAFIVEGASADDNPHNGVWLFDLSGAEAPTQIFSRNSTQLGLPDWNNESTYYNLTGIAWLSDGNHLLVSTRTRNPSAVGTNDYIGGNIFFVDVYNQSAVPLTDFSRIAYVRESYTQIGQFGDSPASFVPSISAFVDDTLVTMTSQYANNRPDVIRIFADLSDGRMASDMYALGEAGVWEMVKISASNDGKILMNGNLIVMSQ